MPGSWRAEETTDESHSLRTGWVARTSPGRLLAEGKLQRSRPTNVSDRVGATRLPTRPRGSHVAAFCILRGRDLPSSSPGSPDVGLFSSSLSQFCINAWTLPLSVHDNAPDANLPSNKCPASIRLTLRHPESAITLRISRVNSFTQHVVASSLFPLFRSGV